MNRYQNIGWQPGHVLSASELKEESFERKHEVIYGEVSGSRDFQLVTLTEENTGRTASGMAENRPGGLQPALLYCDERICAIARYGV